MPILTITHDGVVMAKQQVVFQPSAPAIQFAAITYNFSGLNVQVEAAKHGIAIMQSTDWAAAAQLKAAGVKTFMYQDGLFARQGDSAGLTVQSVWANVDPAWRLLDSSGSWIAGKTAGDFLLDVGHAGYQQAALQHTLGLVAQHPASWSGVFLDDQNAHLAWALPGGTAYPAKYPSDMAWQAAQLSYLATVSQGVRVAGWPVIGNIGGTQYSGTTTTPAMLLASWLRFVDGMLDETFGVGTNGLPTPFSSWQLSLQNQAYCEAQGKLFVANVDSAVESVNTFALCSLLLQAKSNSVWNTTDGRYSKFDQWLPEYGQVAQLGQPIGPHAILPGTNVRQRQFQGGVVQVDPVAHTGSIVLG